MDAEREQRINTLFHAALGRDAAERRAFLAAACGGDDSLRHDVERLIHGAQRAASIAPTAPVDSPLGFVDAPSALGRRFGAYSTTRELGRGGMGSVYLAERSDRQYEKRVAIKLIKRGMDTDAVLQHFRDERQILASLEHAHIARLLDGGTSDDGLPYFVMEYVEGQPIDDYCRRRQLSVTARLRLFLEVCAAVSHAHQHLVVHRDIKPSNILVTEDGAPKLLDFGIAKIVRPAESGDTNADATGWRAMTPDYASPEQVKGLTTTTLSDVYSLGVVLYELLTGRVPYRVAMRTPEEMVVAITTQEPARPSDAVTQLDVASSSGSEADRTGRPDFTRSCEGSPERLRRRLKGDLDNIVLMALRKERERRYQSVEQLAADIRRHLDGLPVVARGDTVLYRGAKFLRRNKLAVGATGLLFVTLLVGIVATMWQARRAAAQEAIAKANQARAERRFNDVRKLAHAVVFDYHDAVRNLSGATPVRARMVRDALEYLDSLSSELQSDRSLQSELAAAYERVSEVQGDPAQPNLGDSAGAIASARKALALRAGLLAADPHDLPSARATAAAHRRLGTFLWQQGDISEAQQQGQQGLALLQATAKLHPLDAHLQWDLADAFQQVGGHLEVQGQLDGALAHYRRKLSIMDTLAGTFGRDPRFRSSLAGGHSDLGDLLARTPDATQALHHHRRALELRASLAAEFPLNVAYRRRVGIAYYYEGDDLVKLGRLREALTSYRKYLSIAEQLAAAEPRNAAYQGDIAFALVRIGDTLTTLGRLDEAVQALRRSLALRSADVRSDPNNQTKQLSLVRSHTKLAKALAKRGDHAETVSESAAAAALIRRFNVAPTHTDVRRVLADSYMELGEAHVTLVSQQRLSSAIELELWREARTLYRRSLEIWHDLDKRQIMNPIDGGKIDAVTRAIARCDRILGAASAPSMSR